DRRAIFVLEHARVGGNADVDRRLEALVYLEQLGNKAPVPVEALRHPPRALLGAVTEADRPVGRELAMISDFLGGLVRKLPKELIARLRQPLEQHVLPGCVEQVPRYRLSEVAVG